MSILRSSAARTAFLSAALVLSLAGCQSPLGQDPESPATPAPAASRSGATPAVTGSASAAKGARLRPCQLVTKAEAESLLGGRLGLTGETSQTCTYAPFPGAPVRKWDLYVDELAIDLVNNDLKTGAAKPLAGVGDQAYESAAFVYLRKGTRWAAIQVKGPDDARAVMIKGARLVATRL